MSAAVATVCAATFGARIVVMDGYGMSSIEGVIAKGDQDEDGLWDLDGRFELVDDNGARFWVNGWCCLIELDEAEAGEGRQGEE